MPICNSIWLNTIQFSLLCCCWTPKANDAWRCAVIFADSAMKDDKVKRHLLLGVKFITLKVWNILLQFLCFNQYYQYTIVLNDSHCTLCDFCGLVDWMSDLCWSIKAKVVILFTRKQKYWFFFNVCFIRRTGLINTVRANKRVGFHQATNSLFTRR